MPNCNMLFPTNTIRNAWILAALMSMAGLAAVVMEPTERIIDQGHRVALGATVPRQFGEWQEEILGGIQMVNPQTQEMLDRVYSEVLVRTYVDTSGYQIMLSIAHGNEQRGNLQVHRPEVCYPAQGFVLHKSLEGKLDTAYGSIPVRRLLTTLGSRSEPLTYWTTVGDTPVTGQFHRRWVELSYGLTGRIPDGILFRVSSIDADEQRAFDIQNRFVDQLLSAISPEDRKRLSGLEYPETNIHPQ